MQPEENRGTRRSWQEDTRRKEVIRSVRRFRHLSSIVGREEAGPNSSRLQAQSGNAPMLHKPIIQWAGRPTN